MRPPDPHTAEIAMQILAWIKDYKQDHGYAPAIRNIADHFHLSSTSYTRHLLGILEKKKLITHTPNVARSIVILEQE